MNNDKSFASITLMPTCTSAESVSKNFFFFIKTVAHSGRCAAYFLVRPILIVTGRNSKHKIVYESLFKLSCDKSYLGLLPSSQCLLRQKPFQLTGTSFRLLTNV